MFLTYSNSEFYFRNIDGKICIVLKITEEYVLS